MLLIEASLTRPVYAKMAEPATMRIVNFVSTANLMSWLHMPLIAEGTGGKYGPKVFPAVIIRSINPRATIMLMPSGSLVVSGAISPDDAVRAMWLVTWILRRLFPVMLRGVSLQNFNVENIVATAYVGYELNIKLFYADHMSQSIYQPKKIKPVRYYPFLPDKRKPVIVMYDTGNIIITGCVTQAESYATFKLVEWHKYRKDFEYRKFDSKPLIQKMVVG